MVYGGIDRLRRAPAFRGSVSAAPRLMMNPTGTGRGAQTLQRADLRRAKLVLSVAGDVGNPAAVKAAAASLRPRSASGSVGTMLGNGKSCPSVCAFFKAEQVLRREVTLE